jgi:carbamoyltransferase
MKGHNILGIKYMSHDTASALMMDGRLIAACEQERYSLDKHSKRFPIDAIHDCLRMGKISLDEIDVIAFGGDPNVSLRRTYLETALKDYRRVGMLIEEFEKFSRIYRVEDTLRSETGYQGPVIYYDHHLAHLASSYYPSGFQNALLLSIDGIGDFKSMKIGVGEGGAISIKYDDFEYPHSLGQIYSAVTCYLGWKNVHHEGIIMALACYGDPYAKVPGFDRSYYSFFEEIIQYDGGYNITINDKWTSYYYMRNKWVSDRFIEVFGPHKTYEMPIEQHHKNIAAALQARLEDVVLSLLKMARKDFNIPNLCMSGGVALNCSMNGRIERSKIFEEIFVQPASGDAGLAIGACYLAQQEYDQSYRPSRNHNFYLGASFESAEIEAAIGAIGLPYSKPEDLYGETAKRLKEGKVVGWFQGGSEFGPRALGNRSILARPYPAAMKDHINNNVKFREYFRPLAPAIMKEYLNEYFDIGQESPHMLIACKVKKEKRDQIIATVHVDDSCRVQSVGSDNNRQFYNLLRSFYDLTGCPVLLNTSFNIKGQPIVNTPQQALDCYKDNQLDVLVIGDYLLEKVKTA